MSNLNLDRTFTAGQGCWQQLGYRVPAIEGGTFDPVFSKSNPGSFFEGKPEIAWRASLTRPGRWLAERY